MGIGSELFKLLGRRRIMRRHSGRPLASRLGLCLALPLFVALMWLYSGRRDWSRDRWVQLAPGRLHVYSAWSELRGDVNEVRVVSLLAPRGSLRGRLLCTLAYNNYSHLQVAAARIESLNDSASSSEHRDGANGDFSLEPGFIFCPGDPQLQADEVGLRLVDTSRVHWLPVGQRARRWSNNAVVCALARRGADVEDSSFAEFLAHYMDLGATHFVFYNHTESWRVRRFLGVFNTQVHFVNIQYLSWSRQSARALLAYDCALRMRGLASVLVVVDTDEFVVPSTSGAQESTGGTGHEWTLAEARGSVMRLSRKVFCEPGSRQGAAQAHLLSRRDRHPDLEPAGVVVAGLDALLSGSALVHHSKLLTLHRYSSEKCPDETTVQDASAAVYEHKALSSAAVMRWRTLFDT